MDLRLILNTCCPEVPYDQRHDSCGKEEIESTRCVLCWKSCSCMLVYFSRFPRASILNTCCFRLYRKAGTYCRPTESFKAYLTCRRFASLWMSRASSMLTLIQKIIWPFTSCRITLSPLQKCWFLPQTSANIFLRLVPKHPEHPIWSSVSMEDCSWELLVCTPPTPLHLIRSCYRDEDGANIEIAEEVRCLYAHCDCDLPWHIGIRLERAMFVSWFSASFFTRSSPTLFIQSSSVIWPPLWKNCDTNICTTLSRSKKNVLLWQMCSTKSQLVFLAIVEYMSRECLVCSRYMLSSNSPLASRLLNTIRQGDYYLLSDDFDSCELKVVINVDCSYWYPSLRYRGTGYGWWGLSR